MKEWEKVEKKFEPGTWVTQDGYGDIWEIVDVAPRYCTVDSGDGEKCWYKKGDRMGDWLYLKKGFTSQFEFAVAFDVIDSRWCENVTKQELETIHSYFEQHPDQEEYFKTIPWKDVYETIEEMVCIKDKAEEAYIREQLNQLPARFTHKELKDFAQERGFASIFIETLDEIEDVSTGFDLKLRYKYYEVNEEKEEVFEYVSLEYAELTF